MKTFLLVFIFSILACAPLFNNGFYTSHDGQSHLIRLAYFSQNLRQGNFFPRWQPELNQGQGYPIFVFTYPLPYYLGSLPTFLGFDLISSFKLILLLSIFLGGYFFYRWTQNLPSAILYIFTPYHFLNLYVRSAFGELVFLAIIPLVFWSIKHQRFKLLSVFFALCILSHLQLSLIFLPVIFLYGLITKFKITHLVFYLLISLLLSSYFWLPSITLISSTLFSQTNQFPPADHLVSLKQLVYSPWGFGFSKPGITDGLSFQLGVVNWLSLFFAKDILILTVILAIILITSNPLSVWNSVILNPIQFPWRLLAVPLFLTPYFFSRIKSKPLIIFLLLLTIYTNRNHIRINQSIFANTPDTHFFQSGTTTATPNEFMPRPEINNPQSYFSTHPIFTISLIISLIGLVLVKYSK